MNLNNNNGTNVEYQNKGQQVVRSFNFKPPKMVQWVTKYSGGLVKNEDQANYILIGISIIIVIISLFLFFNKGQQDFSISPEMEMEIPAEF